MLNVSTKHSSSIIACPAIRFNNFSNLFSMKKLSSILTITTTLLLISNSASAKEGAYIAFGLGQSETVIGNIKYSGLGTALVIGAQFNQEFALEFEYVNYGNLEDTTTKISANSKGMSGIFLLPMTQRASVYFKLGIAQVNSVISGTGVTGVSSSISSIPYGIGLQYDISRRSTLRLFADSGYSHQVSGTTTTITATNFSFGGGINRIGFNSLYNF